jgi:hypothetical protein
VRPRHGDGTADLADTPRRAGPLQPSPAGWRPSERGPVAIQRRCTGQDGIVAGHEDPFDEAANAPYGRQHYGIGNRWAPTSRGRFGCLVLLFGGFVALVVLLVVAGILAIDG